MRALTSGRSGRAATFGSVILILAALAGGPAAAAPDQPWRATEFVVRKAPGQQHEPLLSGDRVIWQDSDPAGARQVAGASLTTGEDLSVELAYPGRPLDLDGDRLLVAEDTGGGALALAIYGLTDGARTLIEPPVLPSASRASARLSGETVAWIEDDADVFARDLRTDQKRRLTTTPAPRESLAAAGNLVVWRDRRNTGPASAESDIYGHDLVSNREFRVTAAPERVGALALAGSVVVWATELPEGPRISGYDLQRAMPLAIAKLPAGTEPITGVAISGDLVLWSVKLAGDSDVFGYDLRQGQPFVVSRAIGDQVRPRIDGRMVVWSDTRNSGLGRDGGDPDIFGARLESGPAAVPAAVGAPGVADARIEILWPHGGAPTADADRANLAAWLFLSDSLDLAPCQWNPRVQLYRAENAEPARLVALGRKTAGRYLAPDGTLIPNWEFNDVDVSAARDPKTRLYFFVALDGVPGRTNVWAHGSDSRTNFPRRDEPAGIALGPTGPQGVEAKIEIVWPHGDAPVDEARLVNVSALVFRAGTLLSVPPEFAPRVRLLRSLNNGYLEPVAVGEKRLIAGPGFTYPAWEFNDVDVSAATNPANRYYFTLAVDGVPAASNVWSHGADARTYAPTLDEPTAGCR